MYVISKIPYFNPWMISNPTLPKMYWEVKSPEQLVANLYCIMDALKNYVNGASDQINANTDKIAELEDLFKKFQESGFDDYYAKQVAAWIASNLEFIYDKTVRQVFFGLTDDGRFCAYVPNSWADIKFDTGAVYGTDEYGRLMLRFDATGTGIINNTVYDSTIMTDTIKAYLKASAGRGLSFDDTTHKINFNAGDGLSLNTSSNTVGVPISSDLTYTSNGLGVSDSFVKYAPEGFELCSLTITSLVDGLKVNNQKTTKIQFWKNEKLMIPRTYADCGFYIYNGTSETLNIKTALRLDVTGNISEIPMLTTNQSQMRNILSLSLNVWSNSYQSFVLYPYILRSEHADLN